MTDREDQGEKLGFCASRRAVRKLWRRLRFACAESPIDRLSSLSRTEAPHYDLLCCCDDDDDDCCDDSLLIPLAVPYYPTPSFSLSLSNPQNRPNKGGHW